MMTGHAYSRSLRAHFLTQRAVGCIIMDKLKITDKACDELRRLYTQYMDSSILPDEIMKSSELGNIILALQSEMKQKAFLSQTSKLWYRYYKQVDLMRMFLRSERFSDWELHLHCVRKMLPYLNAAVPGSSHLIENPLDRKPTRSKTN